MYFGLHLYVAMSEEYSKAKEKKNLKRVRAKKGNLKGKKHKSIQKNLASLGPRKQICFNF